MNQLRRDGGEVVLKIINHLSHEDTVNSTLHDMVIQLDGLFHEMVEKVLPFYQMLNNEQEFQRWFIDSREASNIIVEQIDGTCYTFDTESCAI